MFIVCDQPGLTAGTFARMLEMGKMHPGKIVCAGWKGRTGESRIMGFVLFPGVVQTFR